MIVQKLRLKTSPRQWISNSPRPIIKIRMFQYFRPTTCWKLAKYYKYQSPCYCLERDRCSMGNSSIGQQKVFPTQRYQPPVIRLIVKSFLLLVWYRSDSKKNPSVTVNCSAVFISYVRFFFSSFISPLFTLWFYFIKSVLS